MRSIFTIVICNLLIAFVGPPHASIGCLTQVPDEASGDEADNAIQFEAIAQQTSFMPAPREVLRPLIRAEKELRAGQSKRAAELLGDILSVSNSEDYLVLRPGETSLAVSLRTYAMELMSQLPSGALESYQLRFGVTANKQLEAAVKASDFSAIAGISRQYFFTEAGYMASMMMGYHHFENGQVVAASYEFKRVYDYPAAHKFHDPSLSVMLATCLVLAGEEAKAQTVLQTLKRQSPDQRITFLGQSVPLFADDQDALAWLRTMIGTSSLRNIRLVNEWVMYRGNPQRNGFSEPGFPLPSARWSVPTLNDPDRETIIQERQRQLILSNASTIPAVQPIAVGDTIVMRSFDKLIGVSFQTGKRVWIFPPWDTDMVYTDQEIVHQSFTQFEKLNRGPLWQRMYEDAVYGQVSSDGQSIFVVPYPGIAGGEKLKMVVDRGVILDDPMGQRNYNELIAIDIGREGAFLWEVGGSSGRDEPKLAKALFLGPPLPLGSSLYAICQQDGEVRLVELDPKNGHLRWTQQLASLQRQPKGKYFRLAGATPSFSEGVLVCPTGVGALVGVDIRARSLRWGYQYNSPSARQNVAPITSASESADTLDGLWRDSTIAIHGSTVVYTPIDKQAVVCVDLFTGTPLWQDVVGQAIPGAREDSLYVAAVTGKQIVLVGLDSVRALNRQSAETVWKTSIEKFGAPSGRGYTDGQSYFLPTTGQRLVRIDMEDGRITGDAETSRVLGNLICFRGEVISHGVDQLATFPMDEPNRRMIEAAESRGPLTPAQKFLKAQLLLQRGEIVAAVELMSSAYEQQPTVALRDVLLDSIIRLIAIDFKSGEMFAEPYQNLLIELRSQDFIEARVTGLIKQSKFVDAFNRLVQLLEPIDNFLADDVPQATGLSTSGDDSPLVDLAKDRWFQVSLDKIFQSVDEPDRDHIRQQLSDWILSLTRVNAVNRHDLFRSIGPQFFSDRVHLELVRGLVDEHMILRASSVLDDYCQRYGIDERSRAVALEMYLKLLAENSIEKHVAGESRRFSELRSKWTAEQNQSFESLKKAQPDIGFQDESFALANEWLVSIHDDGTRYLHRCRLLPKNTPDFIQSYRYYFYSHTGEIEVANAVGQPVHRFYARIKSDDPGRLNDQNTVGQIQWFQNVLLINIGSEMFAVDWFKMIRDQDPILWSVDLGEIELREPPVQSDNLWHEYRQNESTVASRVEVGAPGPTGVCFKNENRLVCVDVFSGRTVWQKFRIAPTVQLFGDDKNTVAWDAEKRQLAVFETSSGRNIADATIKIQDGEFFAAVGSRVLLTRKLQSSQTPDSKPTEDSQPAGSPAGLQLDLYDPVSRAIVWSRSFTAGTVASRLPNDRVAFLETDCQFEILNTRDGSVELSTTLNLPIDQRSDVELIHVMEIQGGYMVMMHTSKTNSYYVRLREDRIDLRRFNYGQMLWDGYLEVVDKRTGKPRWRGPARIQHYQFSDYQPFEAPAIVLARSVDRRFERTGPQRFIQLMFVDVYSGRLLAERLVPGNDFLIHKIEGEPLRNQMKFSFYDKQVLVQFENGEVPPAPVACLTLANTAYPKPASFPDEPSVADDESEMKKLKDAVISEQSEREKQMAEMKQLIQQQRIVPPSPASSKRP